MGGALALWGCPANKNRCKFYPTVKTVCPVAFNIAVLSLMDEQCRLCITYAFLDDGGRKLLNPDLCPCTTTETHKTYLGEFPTIIPALKALAPFVDGFPESCTVTGTQAVSFRTTSAASQNNYCKHYLSKFPAWSCRYSQEDIATRFTADTIACNAAIEDTCAPAVASGAAQYAGCRFQQYFVCFGSYFPQPTSVPTSVPTSAPTSAPTP